MEDKQIEVVIENRPSPLEKETRMRPCWSVRRNICRTDNTKADYKKNTL